MVKEASGIKSFGEDQDSQNVNASLINKYQYRPRRKCITEEEAGGSEGRICREPVSNLTRYHLTSSVCSEPLIALRLTKSIARPQNIQLEGERKYYGLKYCNNNTERGNPRRFVWITSDSCCEGERESGRSASLHLTTRCEAHTVVCRHGVWSHSTLGLYHIHNQAPRAKEDAE